MLFCIIPKKVVECCELLDLTSKRLKPGLMGRCPRISEVLIARIVTFQPGGKPHWVCARRPWDPGPG